nr:CD302 antigen [Mirounga angustirostris]
MRTRWATLRRAAELLVLLLRCFGLAEPSGRTGNDPFTIVNENMGKCIKPLNDWIVATDCGGSRDVLWKWVSQHRLFHLQSQKCLGLDITKPTDSLRMFNCDSSALLWWKCEHHSLYGAAQYRLALKNGHAVASTNSSDVWKKGGTEENLCDQPYHGEYWRGTLSHLLLCSMILTEKEGIPRIFWIGLNQLYSARGWEWSDHRPLNFLNWDPDMPSAPMIIGGSSCARMDAMSGLWQSFSCEAQLPYVCKKPLNNTVELTDVWTYLDTHCDAGWLSNNGFCYLLVNESDSWDKAHTKCKALSGDLISIHSLADVEVVVTKLHNGDAKEEIWIGLKNKNVPSLFQWSDGTEVTLTYWNKNEPNVPYNKTPNCVSYLGKLGQWKVQSCEEKLKYVCKKKGEQVNDTTSDKMCPPDEGWKRHGEICYKIYKDEVPFGTNCNLTITSRFEQEYLNDMIKKYTKSPGKYFWTGLRDIDSHGEYSWTGVGGVKQAVTFSNWNFLEPASPGGCVAMATGKSLGKWEVKDCRNFRALSVCKKISGPIQPEEEVAPKPEDPCPEGWHSFPSSLSCYKLFHIERIVRKRNWEEAERFCQALGGHLPSFTHTDEIKEFLHFLMDQFSDQRWLWIGLNKRSPDLLGSWEWSDHTPVSTILMENEFQQDYDIRDCAAVKVTQSPGRRSWYFYDDREFIYLRPFACDTRLEWVCQIPKGRTPKTPDWYNPERAGIHGPPVVIEGSEYWFVADPHLNYEEAVLYCASNHSSLATLTSLAGLKAIKNKIANISGDEQKWWVRTAEKPADRHRSMYSRYPWPHFPITFREECLCMSAKTWFSDLNKPADCGTKLPFICEKYNVSSLEKYSPDSAAKIQCSGDWITFQNKCFLKIKPKSLTFSQASDTCRTYGGTLPSVLSQREQDFITSLLPDMEATLWIGLRWTAYERINKWTDNRELTYSNFHPLLVGGRLKIPTHVIDYEEEYNTTLPQFIPYEDGIYNIIQKKVTWYEALNMCSQSGGYLASVHDQNGQLFLEDLVKRDGFPLWIGLSSHDGSESSFEWSDGSTFDYIPWKDKPSAGNCVVLDPKGIWRHEKCKSVSDGAICYKPTKSKEVSSHTYSSRCPAVKENESQWIQYKEHCYTSDRALRNFSEAKQFCSKLDHSATIVTIEDEDENKFVSRLMRENNNITMRVWLGLSQYSAGQSWNWLDGSKVTFVKWANKSKTGGGKCSVLLASNETWIKVECSQGYGRVVCKVPLDCPSSAWVQFQDSCYIFLKEAIKVGSIEDVRNQCTDHGADMVSIHNEEENAFILDTLKKQWKGPSDILLGMFFDTDDARFKWLDQSNMTFDKWTDQEDGEDLVDTCAFLHTKTGEWKKGDCEISSMEGTLCKSAIPYEKKYLSDNHILISALVIASTVILTVLGAIIWFLYKRNLDSGFTTVFSTAPQSPYNDDCVLVVAEENEYAVQFD